MQTKHKFTIIIFFLLEINIYQRLYKTRYKNETPKDRPIKTFIQVNGHSIC